MRCDICHKLRSVKPSVKEYLTIYGKMCFCDECKVKWENRSSLNPQDTGERNE